MFRLAKCLGNLRIYKKSLFRDYIDTSERDMGASKKRGRPVANKHTCGLWDMQQLGGVCQLWVHQLLGGDERGHLRVHMQGMQGGGKISRRS